jgi:hypothetical protein
VKWSQDFLALVNKARMEDEDYGKAARMMEMGDAALNSEPEQNG